VWAPIGVGLLISWLPRRGGTLPGDIATGLRSLRRKPGIVALLALWLGALVVAPCRATCTRTPSGRRW
jgi:hypothetical protein